MNYDYLLRPPEHHIDDDYYEYLQSHHDCCICREANIHEENLYRTNMGWMCIDCYDAIVNDPDTTEEETPQLV